MMCDFTVGSIPPEMSKKRHVVVVSPRRRRLSGGHLVVPFSTVKPDLVERHHVRFAPNCYKFFRVDTEVWAKCDMIRHVSHLRLDRLYSDEGFITPLLLAEDLQRIQRGMLAALDLI